MAVDDKDAFPLEKIMARLVHRTQPYSANAEYLNDILLWGKVKILAYYFLVVDGEGDEAGPYKLRTNLIFKEEIEQLLEADFSPDAMQLHEKLIRLAQEIQGHIAERCKCTYQAGQVLPLEYLFQVFSLGEFQRHCVTMALLPELERRYERVFAFLQDDLKLRLLSVDLAIKLYKVGLGAQLDVYRYLRAGSPLRKYFFTRQIPQNYSDLSAPLKLDQRMIDFIMDINIENPELENRLEVWYPNEELEPLEFERHIYQELHHYIKQRENSCNPALFFLQGPSGSGKKLQVKHFCREYDQPIMFVDLRRILEEGTQFHQMIDAVCRECIIKQCIVYFSNFESLLGQDHDGHPYIPYLLERTAEFSPMVFLASSQEWKPQQKLLNFTFIPIRFGMPNNSVRKHLWETMSQPYPLAPTIDLAELANKFTFNAGQISRSLEAAKNIAEWGGQAVIGENSLYQGCYRQITHLLGQKTTPVEPIYQWDDLILPAYQKSLLKMACDQVRYGHVVYNEWGFERKMSYGKGLSMLFSGPPGTGKTMAAQVVASKLHLELYKVDLSGVVSKYVGETEKNLHELFTEAKKSQAILFFDEADSLFGKRTEVKDIQDKYGNMEAAFMLQKIEEYDGIVILATNYVQNFDEAFKRRIKFVIDFPFPDTQYREKLWQAIFPAQTPLAEDIDYDYLARQFELSGSNIKNIAVNAAFIAASRQEPVDMRDILIAIRNELAKSGKMVLKEDLGEYYMLLN